MTTIDNIKLDDTNIEFNYASDLVKNTNKIVYLTGKAGTGKTTFLKYLKETTEKNMVILAPTGVAAINAGGQTIHSFFQIKPSIYTPNDKRLRTKVDIDDTDKSTIYDHFKYFKEKIEIIRNMELLVIDEISMVRCDLLDVIDKILRVFRRKENNPFGGVQVVLIGDTFQLPPIADSNQWDILQSYYESPFFFNSKVIEQNKLVYIELKKIYRQKDEKFIDLLNKIRENQLSNNDLTTLNSRYKSSFVIDEKSDYITLATHKGAVNETNLSMLNALKTKLKIFKATISGVFPENIMPTDKVLKIKEGAQVMFIKNDKTKGYYNGKIGKIKNIEKEEIIVETSEGNKIKVEKQNWYNIKYSWDENSKTIKEEIEGKFSQFPIKLAWAITVHKSQGLTFDRVIADLDDAFASGQVYVALSRCTSFDGLILKNPISFNAIKTAPQVLKFAENEKTNALILQKLNSNKPTKVPEKKEFVREKKSDENKLKEKINSLNSKISDYKKEILELKSSLKERNNYVIKIKNDFKEELSEYKSDNKYRKEQINKDNKIIKELRIELESKDLEKMTLKENLLQKEKEIDRLKNLKWYQKLFS